MWHKKGQPTFFTQQLDLLVPKDDRYRILKENIDFSFVNELARPFYGDLGPEGYPPEQLFKMLTIMYLEGISSERALEDEINYNIRYRYFCDLDLSIKAPDHSTFSILRTRLGDGLFLQILDELIKKAFNLGFIRAHHLAIDSTCVLADCAVPPFDENSKDGRKKMIPSRSNVDKDARWGRKSSKKSFFGYKAHYLVDSETDFILSAHTSKGNQKDHLAAEEIFANLDEGFLKEAKTISGDKAYTEGDLRLTLRKDFNLKPVIPFKKEADRGVFKRSHFTFNSDGELICPASKKMRQAYVLKKQKLVVFKGTYCKDCSLKGACTTKVTRTIQFGEDEFLLQSDRQFNQTDYFKNLYSMRSSVERINGLAKRNHGLTRAKLRGTNKVNFQTVMTAIAIDLKKMAKWFANGPPPLKEGLLPG